MKIRIEASALLLSILIMGTAVRAQTSTLEIGITGGINLSTHTDRYSYTGDIAFRPQDVTGYQVGVLARHDFSEVLSMQVEPSVVKLGAQYHQSFVQQDLTYHTESRTRLVYLQLPALAQYSIDPLLEKIIGTQLLYTRFHATGGLFWGYLLNAQFKGMNYTSRTFDAMEEGAFSSDVMNHYSKYDVGFIAGLGWEYDQIIGFDARLQYTVMQQYNGEPRYKPKNLAFMFSLNYLIFRD